MKQFGKSLIIILRTPALLLIAVGLGSCMATPISLMDERPGHTLAVGDSSRIHFFTSAPDQDTGIILNAGGHYTMRVNLLSHWADSYITVNENGEPLDERGFANSEMPAAWLGKLRRSTSHQWFELMLYQPRCKSDSLRGVSDLQYNESSGSYSFVATCDGKLALFVNDNYLAYANNTGYANIAFARVN